MLRSMGLQRVGHDLATEQQVNLLKLYLLVIGEGNGTPLQYSCLENPIDGGAWWAAVHGVAKSRTWLSNFTFTFHFHALEKEMAADSSVLAWRIPGTGEPGGLPSMRSQRVGHDWSDLAAGSSLLSLFRIIFQADCLTPPHLVVLLGFYLETYFSMLVLSKFLHLSFSLLTLQVYSSFASAVHPLVVEDGSGTCAGFLVVGTNASPLVGGAGSYPSIQFSRSVTSDSLRSHELQHARPPCPSPTPGVHPNPCPLCRWYHPTISSSVQMSSQCKKKEWPQYVFLSMSYTWSSLARLS